MVIAARRLFALALITAALGCNAIAGIHEGVLDACLDDPDAPGCGEGGAPSTTSTSTTSSTTSTTSSTGGAPVCGDGTVDPGEECDDGGTAPGDGCAPDCTVECGAPGMFEAPDTHHCYWLPSVDKVDWSTARAQCTAMNGWALAAITSAFELTLIAPHLPEDTWIGASDQADEGTFTWTDGEPFSWAAWTQGAPTTSKAEEDCVVIVAKLPAFDDIDCTQKRRFLCERPAPGTSP